MSFPSILHHPLRFLLHALIPLSILSTTWLYLYPVFHLCTFPSPPSNSFLFLRTLAQHLHLPLNDNDGIAPFRLLVFGDPQLEGDTSLPVDGWRGGILNFPSLGRLVPLLREADNLTAKGDVVVRQLRAFVEEDVIRAVAIARKMLDLWGNDYYLAHIYRTMRWWTKPTHVVVLGDLLGSQWIDDEEFGRRGGRFWNRVFRGGRRVADEVTMGLAGERVEVLGEDEGEWNERLGCVVGNHDAGYAGDMTEERVERFERVFGGVNWDVRFQLPGRVENTTTPPPSLHLITLNSLNLDTPALSATLQNKTYAFLNNLIASLPPAAPTDFTVLLTHLPLHKPPGTCTDAPFFAFHDGGFGNGVREQNHLSEGSSKALLEGLFGMGAEGDAGGRNGIILTGHDHEGCDVYHHPSPNSTSYHPYNTTTSGSKGSLREITVRSMMGSYGGNAGLLSVWFDQQKGGWEYGYGDCRAGVQHWWWGVPVLDFVTGVAAVVVWLLGGVGEERRRRRKGGSKREGKRGAGSGGGKGSARRKRRKV